MPQENKIFCGDNLTWLDSLENSSIDFCYIDPPFFSGKDYGDENASFTDKWTGLKAYVDWMSDRLQKIFRVLSPNGVLAVHLDYHAVHYIKVELDRIFGQGNKEIGRKLFINEIFWRRKNGGGMAKGCRKLPVVIDQILVYAKSKKYFLGNNFLNDLKNPSDKIKKMYRHQDEKGLFRWAPLSAPSDSPSLKFNFHGFKPHKNGWRWDKKRMEEAWQKGLIGEGPSGKNLRYKLYLKDRKGLPITNYWDDLNYLTGSSKESTGYPTQKPEKLIARLLNIFTKENDLILDCFCGSGTTAKVAADLNRRFIVGDASLDAIRITTERLKKFHPELKFEVVVQDKVAA